MKNQDKQTATYLMLCVLVVIVGACSNPTRHSIPSLDNASTDIVQDLSVANGDTVVIQMTQTDLEREELGLRDEAVVLTENNGKFTLRYVYRFPQSRKLNFRRWQVLVALIFERDFSGEFFSGSCFDFELLLLCGT